MSSNVRELSSIGRIRVIIGAALSGQSRVRIMRALIVMNVIYTVIFGVILAVQSLHSLKVILFSSHQTLNSWLNAFGKPAFLAVVISGHLFGLFGLIHKKPILLLSSAAIGLHSVVVYICLMAYHFKTVPVVVVMFGALVSHTLLGVCSLSVIIAFTMFYKTRKLPFGINSH